MRCVIWPSSECACARALPHAIIQCVIFIYGIHYFTSCFLHRSNPLATAYDNVAAIIAAGGVPPIVALLLPGRTSGPSCSTEPCKEHVAACLCNLAKRNAYRMAIAQAGGVAALLALARDGRSENQVTHAAFALGGIAFCNEANKAAIIAAGGVDVLSEIAKTAASRAQQQTAAYALKHVLAPPPAPPPEVAPAEAPKKGGKKK